MSWPRLLADLIVVVHLAYVGFVVFGLVGIVVGLAMRRGWARNLWLRIVHLAMILIVVLESWAGVVCPLTTWEDALRRRAGQEAYAHGFIEDWTHRILFYQAPSWVF